MTTYEKHAPRSIRWDTAKVLDGKLRVELTAEHADSPVWKSIAQEIIDRWSKTAPDLPWHRVSAGNTSLFVEGIDPELTDVAAVQTRLEALASAVNGEIAERARAEVRAEEERREAERAARERDDRLTAAFRVAPDPPETDAAPPPAPTERHRGAGLLRRPHASASSSEA